MVAVLNGWAPGGGPGEEVAVLGTAASLRGAGAGAQGRTGGSVPGHRPGLFFSPRAIGSHGLSRFIAFKAPTKSRIRRSLVGTGLLPRGARSSPGPFSPGHWEALATSGISA